MPENQDLPKHYKVKRPEPGKVILDFGRGIELLFTDPNVSPAELNPGKPTVGGVGVSAYSDDAPSPLPSSVASLLGFHGELTGDRVAEINKLQSQLDSFFPVQSLVNKLVRESEKQKEKTRVLRNLAKTMFGGQPVKKQPLPKEEPAPPLPWHQRALNWMDNNRLATALIGLLALSSLVGGGYGLYRLTRGSGKEKEKEKEKEKDRKAKAAAAQVKLAADLARSLIYARKALL